MKQTWKQYKRRMILDFIIYCKVLFYLTSFKNSLMYIRLSYESMSWIICPSGDAELSPLLHFQLTRHNALLIVKLNVRFILMSFFHLEKCGFCNHIKLKLLFFVMNTDQKLNTGGQPSINRRHISMILNISKST